MGFVLVNYLEKYLVNLIIWQSCLDLTLEQNVLDDGVNNFLIIACFLNFRSFLLINLPERFGLPPADPIEPIHWL